MTEIVISELLLFSPLQQIYDGIGVLIFGVDACLHWVDKGACLFRSLFCNSSYETGSTKFIQGIIANLSEL